MFWRNPIYGHLNYSFPHHRLCLGTNCQSHASWGLVSFGPWWSKYYLYSFVIWGFKVWSSGRWYYQVCPGEMGGQHWGVGHHLSHLRPSERPSSGHSGLSRGLRSLHLPCAPIPLKVNENYQTWRILFHMPPYYRSNWKNSCKYHPTWTENITFCLILRPIFAHCHQISWSVAIFNKQGDLVKTSLCSALIWWFLVCWVDVCISLVQSGFTWNFHPVHIKHSCDRTQLSKTTISVLVWLWLIEKTWSLHEAKENQKVHQSQIRKTGIRD